MLEKLTRALDKNTAILIVDPANRRYYTGMETSNGFVLATAEKSCFYTDFRYITAAKATVYGDIEVCLIKKSMAAEINDFISGKGIENLMIEEDYLSYKAVEGLKAALTGVALADGQSTITLPRSIKSEKEIESIKAAQRITDESFIYICDFIRENKNKGLTEKRIALELEHKERLLGSEEMPFSIIIASGKNSALPHAVPTDKIIESGDFLTMDYGAKYNGYCSDMTRTVAIDFVTDEQKKIYDTVLAAQAAALDGIKAGMRGCECDEIARKVIRDAGYGEYFGHSLGHSVGLEIHEAPNFSPSCQTVIPAGAVLSDEPGIYIAGFCGVRIEDLVIVGENGVTDITNSEKGLIIL